MIIACLLKYGQFCVHEVEMPSGNSTGRAPSCRDVEAIKKMLKPFVSHAMCFGYAADRKIAATNREALLSDKYQRLFRAGEIVMAMYATCKARARGKGILKNITKP
jgi:hypothetical protein